jgi:diguanylate cyclase (GGDEF)-like protein
LVTAYSIWVLATPFDPTVEQAISSLLLILLDVSVLGLGLWLATRTTANRRLKRSWIMIGLAYLSYGIGEAIWFEYESVLHLSPFPSSADLFYLLYYPLLLLGIMSLPFAPTDRDDATVMWLDLGIVVGASAILTWFFLVAPRWTPGQVDWATIISIAYPVGDLLILAGVVALIFRDVERVQRGVMFLLVLGIAVMTIPDALFAYFENFAVPYSMPPLNILWMASSLCVLAALVRQLAGVGDVTTEPAARARPIQLLRIWLPYVATALGLGLLMLVTVFTSQAPSLYVRGTVQGALVLVALVLLRQYVVLRQNIRLRLSTQQLAVTDDLTGVYNRRYLSEALEREIYRAERYGHPFSVVLFDLDGFKNLNDTHGHLVGDDVLRSLAQLILRQVRRVDILARFGGDEFALVLPETDVAGAAAVERKIKNSVSTRGVRGQPLSISAGIAIFKTGSTADVLLHEADMALYRDKGRRAVATPGSAPARSER